MTFPLVLHVPDALFSRLKQQAEQSQRSIEEVVVDIVAQAMPATTMLSDDLVAAIAQLPLLPNDALWRTAQSRLSRQVSARLATLHLRRQRDGLSEAEALEAQRLTQRYEQALLVRAEAIRLLAERGLDVQTLRTAPQ